jgi:hypothetical protein
VGTQQHAHDGIISDRSCVEALPPVALSLRVCAGLVGEQQTDRDPPPTLTSQSTAR